MSNIDNDSEHKSNGDREIHWIWLHRRIYSMFWLVSLLLFFLSVFSFVYTCLYALASKARTIAKIKFDETESYWRELRMTACCYGNGNGWLLTARPNIKYASYFARNNWTAKPLNKRTEKKMGERLRVWAWDCLLGGKSAEYVCVCARAFIACAIQWERRCFSFIKLNRKRKPAILCSLVCSMTG